MKNTNEPPNREDIEQFIQALAEGAADPGVPVSWREVDDPDENSYRVLVTFQFDAEPHQHARFGPHMHESPTPSVRKVVESLEDRTDHGAPLGAVVSRLTDEGVDDPEAEVEQWKRRGEIYEPREDHLRAV